MEMSSKHSAEGSTIECLSTLHERMKSSTKQLDLKELNKNLIPQEKLVHGSKESKDVTVNGKTTKLLTVADIIANEIAIAKRNKYNEKYRPKNDITTCEDKSNESIRFKATFDDKTKKLKDIKSIENILFDYKKEYIFTPKSSTGYPTIFLFGANLFTPTSRHVPKQTTSLETIPSTTSAEEFPHKPSTSSSEKKHAAMFEDNSCALTSGDTSCKEFDYNTSTPTSKDIPTELLEAKPSTSKDENLELIEEKAQKSLDDSNEIIGTILSTLVFRDEFKNTTKAETSTLSSTDEPTREFGANLSTSTFEDKTPVTSEAELMLTGDKPSQVTENIKCTSKSRDEVNKTSTAEPSAQSSCNDSTKELEANPCTKTSEDGPSELLKVELSKSSEPPTPVSSIENSQKSEAKPPAQASGDKPEEYEATEKNGNKPTKASGKELSTTRSENKTTKVKTSTLTSEAKQGVLTSGEDGPSELLKVESMSKSSEPPTPVSSIKNSQKSEAKPPLQASGDKPEEYGATEKNGNKPTKALENELSTTKSENKTTKVKTSTLTSEAKQCVLTSGEKFTTLLNVTSGGKSTLEFGAKSSPKDKVDDAIGSKPKSNSGFKPTVPFNTKPIISKPEKKSLEMRSKPTTQTSLVKSNATSEAKAITLAKQVKSGGQPTVALRKPVEARLGDKPTALVTAKPSTTTSRDNSNTAAESAVKSPILTSGCKSIVAKPFIVHPSQVLGSQIAAEVATNVEKVMEKYMRNIESRFTDSYDQQIEQYLISKRTYELLKNKDNLAVDDGIGDSNDDRNRNEDLRSKLQQCESNLKSHEEEMDQLKSEYKTCMEKCEQQNIMIEQFKLKIEELESKLESLTK